MNSMQYVVMTSPSFYVFSDNCLKQKKKLSKAKKKSTRQNVTYFPEESRDTEPLTWPKLCPWLNCDKKSYVTIPNVSKPPSFKHSTI